MSSDNKQPISLIEEKAKANDIVMNVSYYAVLNGGQGINRVQNPDIFRFSKPGEVIPTASVYGQLEKELTEISQRLAREGVRLIVQAPLPEYRAKAEQCVPTWFGAKSGLNADCFTERSLNLDYRQKLMNALKSVQQQTDSFYVWDVFDELCPERMCSHFEQGKPLFFDDDHLSVYGSKSLSSNFGQLLENARTNIKSEDAVSVESFVVNRLITADYCFMSGSLSLWMNRLSRVNKESRYQTIINSHL